jgi:hypothetical protein
MLLAAPVKLPDSPSLGLLPLAPRPQLICGALAVLVALRIDSVVNVPDPVAPLPPPLPPPWTIDEAMLLLLEALMAAAADIAAMECGDDASLSCAAGSNDSNPSLPA